MLHKKYSSSLVMITELRSALTSAFRLMLYEKIARHHLQRISCTILTIIEQMLVNRIINLFKIKQSLTSGVMHQEPSQIIFFWSRPMVFAGVEKVSFNENMEHHI